jgi:hypothetical protein
MFPARVEVAHLYGSFMSKHNMYETLHRQREKSRTGTGSIKLVSRGIRPVTGGINPVTGSIMTATCIIRPVTGSIRPVTGSPVTGTVPVPYQYIDCVC